MAAPSPSFASIVRYVVRDGYMTEILARFTSAPSMEADYQHTMQSGEDKICNITLVPDPSYMITKEEPGTNWLYNVELMLVKFPNGSRANACSGPIMHYCFS